LKIDKAEHFELEKKFDAKLVSVEQFKSWGFSKNPNEYLHAIGPDLYYVQGKNVLRHRQNGDGAGQMTVKQRTSKRSTVLRGEIDLNFSHLNTVDDVTKFLRATGWREKFTVIKDCHIFSFRDSMPHMEAVIYDVRCFYPGGCEGVPYRFLEIEVHKSHNKHPKSHAALQIWEADLRKVLPVGKIMTKSLYEIYSGKRYAKMS
jgi:adenylate cyclase class IV